MIQAQFHASAHSKISLDTAADRDFWSGYFGASAAELRDAVKTVGCYLVSVEDYLGSQSEARRKSRAAGVVRIA